MNDVIVNCRRRPHEILAAHVGKVKGWKRIAECFDGCVIMFGKKYHGIRIMGLCAVKGSWIVKDVCSGEIEILSNSDFRSKYEAIEP